MLLPKRTHAARNQQQLTREAAAPGLLPHSLPFPGHLLFGHEHRLVLSSQKPCKVLIVILINKSGHFGPRPQSWSVAALGFENTTITPTVQDPRPYNTLLRKKTPEGREAPVVSAGSREQDTASPQTRPSGTRPKAPAARSLGCVSAAGGRGAPLTLEKPGRAAVKRGAPELASSEPAGSAAQTTKPPAPQTVASKSAPPARVGAPQQAAATAPPLSRAAYPGPAPPHSPARRHRLPAPSARSAAQTTATVQLRRPHPASLSHLPPAPCGATPARCPLPWPVPLPPPRRRRRRRTDRQSTRAPPP